jgi:RNA polymerase sigma factor (sigma-70 family)
MISDSSALAVRAANDPQAFTELYDAYFPRIYNYVRCRCYDLVTADDLTAQVFERLLDHIGQYAPGRGPFEAWLFAIARNVVNSHYRGMRFPWLAWEELHHQPAGGSNLEETVVSHQAQGDLLAALSRLDARSRDVLSLKYAASLSSRQIAQMTRLSESNVRVILHRALERLRTLLVESQDGIVKVCLDEELENEHA